MSGATYGLEKDGSILWALERWHGLTDSMDSRRMVWMNRFNGLEEEGTDELFAGQQWRRRHRGQTYGHGRGGEGGGRGWDERRERPGTTHPAVRGTDGQEEFAE